MPVKPNRRLRTGRLTPITQMRCPVMRLQAIHQTPRPWKREVTTQDALPVKATRPRRLRTTRRGWKGSGTLHGLSITFRRSRAI